MNWTEIKELKDELVKSPFFYSLAGFGVGLLFPLVSLPLLLLQEGLPFDWKGIARLHSVYPNLWTLDLAPFFLAGFAAFVQEKNQQVLSKGIEFHFIPPLAGSAILVSSVVLLSLFLPGNEVNLAIALPIALLGILAGVLFYFYPPYLAPRLNLYFGGFPPVLGFSILMLGTGGAESRYFLLFLIPIIFGIAYNGLAGFFINGAYAVLGLASPLFYTPFAEFYVHYLFTTVPLFFLVGFVILEVFELKKLDIALAGAYQTLEKAFEDLKGAQEKNIAAERKAAISKLAMTAAHEIFNRLTPLVGFAEILKKGISPDDPRYHAIAHIEQQSREIEKIVASMAKLDHEKTRTVGDMEIIDLEKNNSGK